MIEVLDVGKRFNSSWVIRNVSLEVRPGEMIGLIGSSGSGKSTILRSINGLLRIDEGSIKVADQTLLPDPQPINGNGVLIRQRVGMVFQHLNLWPYRTALENIVDALIYVKRLKKPVAIEKAREWASRLGIESQLNKYPSMLSGGQRQRVAIARAVVMEPQFLLLDEITSSLDPILAGEIAEIMAKLAQEGLGIIFVSHQIDFIRRNASKVYFLDGGHIKESGLPSEILTRPASKELGQFIESVRHGW